MFATEYLACQLPILCACGLGFFCVAVYSFYDVGGHPCESKYPINIWMQYRDGLICPLGNLINHLHLKNTIIMLSRSCLDFDKLMRYTKRGLVLIFSVSKYEAGPH